MQAPLRFPVLAILLPFEIRGRAILFPAPTLFWRGAGGLFLYLISTDCTSAEGHRYRFKEDNLLPETGMKIPTRQSILSRLRPVPLC